MTRQSNIIYPEQFRASLPMTGLDRAAYNRRAERRYRRAAVCQIVTTLADLLASAGIGLCLLLALAVFAGIF